MTTPNSFETSSINTTASNQTTPMTSGTSPDIPSSFVLQLFNDLSKRYEEKHNELMTRYNFQEIEVTNLQEELKKLTSEFEEFKNHTNKSLSEINTLASNALNVGNEAKEKTKHALLEMQQLKQDLLKATTQLQQNGSFNQQITQSLQTVSTDITNLQTSLSQANQKISTLQTSVQTTQTTAQNTTNTLNTLIQNMNRAARYK